MQVHHNHRTPSCTSIIIHTPPCHPSHAVVYQHHHSHAVMSSITRRRLPSSSFTRRHVIHHTPSCTSIGDNNGCRPCTGNFHQMLTRLFCRPLDGRPRLRQTCGSITITARRRVPASSFTRRHVIHHTPSCTCLLYTSPSPRD